MTREEAMARAAGIAGRFGQACVDGGCVPDCRITCQARVRLIADGILEAIRADKRAVPHDARPVRLVVSR